MIDVAASCLDAEAAEAEGTRREGCERTGILLQHPIATTSLASALPRAVKLSEQ